MQNFVERRFIVFDGFLKAPVICELVLSIYQILLRVPAFATDKFISDYQEAFFFSLSSWDFFFPTFSVSEENFERFLFIL